MRRQKKIDRARERLERFDPRGSNCPICKQPFRHGCDHTVKQAEQKLFQRYVEEIAK